jgi:serine/threonine protein kinase
MGVCLIFDKSASGGGDVNHVSNNDRHAPPLPDIAGYRVLRVLNHGGMSTVYLGQQLALSREVAIKVMQSQALSDEVSRRRFENEARTIARLEHPHIVSIYEVGRTGDACPITRCRTWRAATSASAASSARTA